MMTEATTPIQAGSATALKRPKPRASASEGKTDGRGGKENADQERVHHHHAEIVRPPPAAPDGLFPSRPDEFPDRHDGKHTAKGGQTDIGFVCEQQRHAWLCDRSRALDQWIESSIIQSFT